MTKSVDSQRMEEFLEKACLTYSERTGPQSFALAATLLEEIPEIVEESFLAAAVVGHVASLERCLGANSNMVNHKGGPYQWPPLLYLTYGRVIDPHGRSDFEAAMKLVLTHGADPNAFFLWGDTYYFTALTGCFGEGEGGPVALPVHPRAEQLARLLLQAGANPNDGQALYNTMFTPDSRCLSLCLEFGLKPHHTLNWIKDTPVGTLDFQLHYAVKDRNLERVRILLQAGANPNDRPEGRLSLYRIAVRHYALDEASILLEAGGQNDATSSDHFFSACLEPNINRARELLLAEPNLIDQLDPMDGCLLHRCAERALRDSLELLLSLGMDINEREPQGYRHTALHKAALMGHLDTVKLLVAHGADVHIKDASYNGTPAGWAAHHGHPKVAEFLKDQ